MRSLLLEGPAVLAYELRHIRLLKFYSLTLHAFLNMNQFSCFKNQSDEVTGSP